MHINYTKAVFFVCLVFMIVSCTKSFEDGLIHEPNHIDSIVVNNVVPLELSHGGTVNVAMSVYPITSVMDKSRLCLQNRKVEGGFESKAYKFVELKKDPDSENVYILYIADTDVGYGYRDTVCICYQNTDSEVKSNEFEIRNSGTSLYYFSLSDGVTTWDSFNIINDTLQIQVPNSFDLKKATVAFKHNGASVFLDDDRQISGEGTHNFSDFCNPLEYVVKGFDGDEKKYTIEVFNLPVVYVNTPDSVEITSRNEWLGNCSFIVRDTDGSVEDYGEANLKGRGNWTWRRGLETGKKPYAIKLANKPKDRSVLGMPGHKRWVLLSNPVSFLPNPLGFEVNRRAESCRWAPRSRFVELMLNGKHQGLYLLCEQIRIDKNRIDINELKKGDIDGEALTGGYLVSYDDAYEDDDPTYYSSYFKMPFMIKNPDTEDIKPQQLEYITNYIKDAELSLYDDERFQNKDFYDFFDIDSWIDYYFVAELWGALEMIRPRSVWLYKDRGGKLTAGPLWDFESNFFDKQELYCNNALYYGRLFQSYEVVNRLRSRWVQFRSNVIGNDSFCSIIEYLDSLYEECHYSADRDRKKTPESFYGHLPYPESKIDYEYHHIRDNILVKLKWLENQIMSW